MKTYKGISFPFRFGSGGGVLTSKADSYEDTHIQESILQIILTNKGERPMEPMFGSDIRRLIFSGTGTSFDSLVTQMALSALSTWEKRIQVINIVIVREYGKIFMDITYIPVTTQQPTTFRIDFGGGMSG